MRRAGFTLIEISIVLVIIGVVVGGIMTARYMLRSSEIRGTYAQLQEFTAAIKAFELEYGALPGDFALAKSVWPTDCVDVAGSNCNGNGNNRISEGAEVWRVWQHLALGGYIGGSYTGDHGAGSGSDAVIGENIPASPIDGAGYMLAYRAPVTASAYYFVTTKEGHRVLFGTDGGTGSSVQGPVLSPKEAFQFDMKYDDGRPGLGDIRSTWKGSYGYKSGSDRCANSDTAATARYNKSVTTIACPLDIYLPID